MADPVKTLLLKAIENAVKGISGVGTVIRNPSKPPDKETAVFPVVHIWDEPESIEERNRIARCTFVLQVDWWTDVHESLGSDAADKFQADSLMAFLTDTGIRNYAMKIGPVPGGAGEEWWSNKGMIDEFFYGLAMRYEVKYAYVWGNPYALAKNP